MTVIVTDANVLVTALADDDQDGDRARRRRRGESLIASVLVDLGKFASVFRRLVRGGHLPVRRAELALKDLSLLPMVRIPQRRAVARYWTHRHNLTVYDSSYVASA